MSELGESIYCNNNNQQQRMSPSRGAAGTVERSVDENIHTTGNASSLPAAATA